MAPQATSSVMRLIRPQAGVKTVVDIADSVNQMALEFPVNDASLERSGNDLVFSFEDGAAVAVKDFYTAFTSKTVPDIQTEGTLVSGEAFFAALDSSLMPAAGDTAATDAAGRFQDWASSAVLGGIDSLGGLQPGVFGAATPAATLLAGAASEGPTRTALAGNADSGTGADPFIPRVTLHNEFSQGSVSISSSYGYYIKDSATGAPLDGKLFIIWDNVGENTGQSFTIEGYTPDQLGFFMIPGGATADNGYMNGTRTGDDYALYDASGNPLDMDRTVVFDQSGLNPDTVHNFISLDGRYQFWEDQKMGHSDWDMDDIRVKVEYNGWPDAGQADSVDSPFGNTYEREDGSLVMFGKAGGHADTLTGSQNDDMLIGNYGDDKLYGEAGDDVICGGSGQDMLFGGAGNDILLGGAGNDYLVGGPGNNYLAGESGADTFAWLAGQLDAGKDVLADFNLSEGDRLLFEGMNLNNVTFDAANSAFTITLDDGNTRTITLEGEHGLDGTNWTKAFHEDSSWVTATASEADYAAVAEAVRTIEATMGA